MKKKVVVVLLSGYALFLISLTGCNYLFPDSAQYLILARSLKMGQGYRMLNFPGDPPCEYYPPLWPLVLSFFISPWGENLWGARIINIVILILITAIVWLVFSREEKIISWFIMGFLAFNSQFLLLNNQLLSEPLFILLLYIFLLLIGKYENRADRKILVSCGIVAGLIYMSRYIGILIPACCLVYFYHRKKFAPVILLLGIFSVFFIPWIVRNSWVNSIFSGSHLKNIFSSSYIALTPLWVYSFPMRYLVLLNYMVYDLTFLFIPVHNLRVLRYLIVFFVILGMGGRIMRKNPGFGDLFFSVYVLTLPLWPYYQEYKRLLLPVFPFAIFYLLSGVKMVLKTKYFLAISVLGLGGYIIISYKSLVEFNRIKEQEYQGIQEVCSWVQKNVPPQEVMLSPDSALFYIYTKRKTIGYRMSVGTLIPLIHYFKINYIIYNKEDEWAKKYFYSLIRLLDFKPVVDRGKWRIYRK